jgi:hypothetical protein
MSAPLAPCVADGAPEHGFIGFTPYAVQHGYTADGEHVEVLVFEEDAPLAAVIRAADAALCDVIHLARPRQSRPAA